MKKIMNVIVLLFLSALSYINYWYFIGLVSVYFILGDKLIHGFDATKNWVSIVEPVSSLILSILTGIVFNFLHKKKLKKTRIAFSVFQLLLFAFCLYKIIEIGNDHTPLPIYK